LSGSWALDIYVPSDAYDPDDDTLRSWEYLVQFPASLVRPAPSSRRWDVRKELR
jgi:hypothetical protein